MLEGGKGAQQLTLYNYETIVAVRHRLLEILDFCDWYEVESR